MLHIRMTKKLGLELLFGLVLVIARSAIAVTASCGEPVRLHRLKTGLRNSVLSLYSELAPNCPSSSYW